MKLCLRLLWIPLLAWSCAWLIEHVPGTTLSSSGEDARIVVGALVAQVSDVRLFLFALLAMLAVGRTGAIRAAIRLVRGSRGDEQEAGERTADDRRAVGSMLAAGARGLLWGTFLWSTILVVSFYWPHPPEESTGLLGNFHNLAIVKSGALPAIVLGCFALLLGAERTAPLSSATKVARAIDGVSLLGLFACSWSAITMILVYRAAPLRGDGIRDLFLAPTLAGVDATFVAWSTVVVLLLPWLALAPYFGPPSWLHAFRLPRDPEAHALLGRVGRMSLAAGVLVAVLVQAAGLHHIARTGGNGNPAELQPLAGEMLVPLAVGALLYVITWFRPAPEAQPHPA